MNENSKLDVLRSLINDSISSFEKKRNRNRNKAFLAHFGATAISAAVTVLLGLQGINDGQVIYVRNAALILSAIVTVLTGFDAFFNHRALWVRYTQTVSQLYEVRAK